MPQTPYTSLCVQGVQRKPPRTALVRRWRQAKRQRRAWGDLSASGAAAGARTLAAGTGQSPGLSAGRNAPVAGIGWKHAGAARQFHFRACRHPSPGCTSPASCEFARPRLLLGRKVMFLRLTSPGRARWLPNGWRGGPCPGRLAKFAYGEGEPLAEQEHVGAMTPSRRAGPGLGCSGGGRRGPLPWGAESTGQPRLPPSPAAEPAGPA